MVKDLTIIVSLQMQNYSFRPTLRDKLSSNSADKLVWVLLELSGEAVDSEVDSSESLDDRIISKYANISPRPKAR